MDGGGSVHHAPSWRALTVRSADGQERRISACFPALLGELRVLDLSRGVLPGVAKGSCGQWAVSSGSGRRMRAQRTQAACRGGHRHRGSLPASLTRCAHRPPSRRAPHPTRRPLRRARSGDYCVRARRRVSLSCTLACARWRIHAWAESKGCMTLAICVSRGGVRVEETSERPAHPAAPQILSAEF